MTLLYPQKLALTSPTGGGRSVGIVRSRTKATEFSLEFFTSSYIYTFLNLNINYHLVNIIPLVPLMNKTNFFHIFHYFGLSALVCFPFMPRSPQGSVALTFPTEILDMFLSHLSCYISYQSIPAEFAYTSNFVYVTNYEGPHCIIFSILLLLALL